MPHQDQERASSHTAHRWGEADILHVGVPIVECVFVKPVNHHDRACIHIVVCRSRPVNDYRPHETINQLETEVRMVPGRPVLGGLEAVRIRLARRDGALDDPGCA